MDIYICLHCCVVLSILIKISPEAVLGCDESKVCPPEKPLCTPVGCVVKCPENSFQRGTKCVTDCGDGVVDGDKCKDACPPDKVYTYERTFVQDNTFRRVRICLNSCDVTNQFLVAYKNSCVSVCPGESTYIFNKTCSQMCPTSHAFKYDKRDMQVNVSNTICMEKCPTDRPFARNFTCVPRCGQDEVLLGNECVENCPNDSYAVYENRCTMRCPFPKYKRNSTCVRSCLDEITSDPRMLFILDGTCLENCPEDYKFFWNASHGYQCSRDCGKGYSRGAECVEKCYHKVVNRSCVEKCPSSLPYCVEVNHWMWDGSWGVNVIENTCVSDCPEKMFNDNFTCVNRCPKSYLHNRTCTEICPSEFPLSNGQECVENCPDSAYVLNVSCAKWCPYVSYNKTCVDKCPSATYISNKECVNECPKGRLYLGNRCVFKCSEENVIYNNTCLNDCPVEAPFSYRSCTPSAGCFSLDKGNPVCLYECPEKTFRQNYTCVHKCPMFVYNNQCVSECPPEQPLIEHDILQMQNKGLCVKKCSTDNLSNGTHCIPNYECQKLIKFDGQCLDICPKGTYWVGDSLSDIYSENCQSAWFFTGAILVSLIVMVLVIVCVVRCYRLWPLCCRAACCKGVKRARVSRGQDTEENQSLLNELMTAEDQEHRDVHNYAI